MACLLQTFNLICSKDSFSLFVICFESQMIIMGPQKTLFLFKIETFNTQFEETCRLETRTVGRQSLKIYLERKTWQVHFKKCMLHRRARLIFEQSRKKEIDLNIF